MAISLTWKTKAKSFFDSSWWHKFLKRGSVCSPSSVHFLQFSLESIPLGLLSVPLHWSLVKVSNIHKTPTSLNLMIKFQLTAHLTHQQQLMRLVTPAFPKHFVSLVTRISQFPPGSVPQSPWLNAPHFPSLNVAVVPGSPFFYIYSYSLGGHNPSWGFKITAKC